MTLKQKLESAYFELGKLKALADEKQLECDRLFKLIAVGSKSARSPKLAGPVKTETAPSVHLENGSGGTATDDIEQLLASDPKKEFSYSDVLTKLPNVKKQSVAALLFRLKRDGKVQKVGRGLWKTTKLI